MRNLLYNLATDQYRTLPAAAAKFLLWALSLLYGLSVRIVSFLKLSRAKQLGCKVISVGNITLGGTGKTSLVEYIARLLKDNGWKVAILTRGYKRNTKTYDLMGDEPAMLAKNLGNVPVVVDADRASGAKKAINEYSSDTVILDDGFQQWGIKKDLEIVTIDATDPFGNQQLLPRGILREGLSALRRADIFILAKTNLNPDIREIKDFLAQANPKAEIFEAAHLPLGFYAIDAVDKIINAQALKGKTAAIFCGIGDPDSFESLILSLGINIGLSFRFPDHHQYTQQEIEEIIRKAEEKKCEIIITTQKDAARFSSLQCLAAYSLKLYVLLIKLTITHDQERFHHRLLGL